MLNMGWSSAMTRLRGLALLVALLAALPADAQSKFYEGKTVRIVVGFGAGGGYETYSRAIGRHLGRHIPGKPTVIVENMPGAGSLIAANHAYKIARPDGLTIGNFAGGLVLAQALGQPASSSTPGSSPGSARRRAG